ncbi:MAG: hypothetical protein B7Z61_12205, partial [Acidobacteria bacterium 37-71-11]
MCTARGGGDDGAGAGSIRRAVRTRLRRAPRWGQLAGARVPRRRRPAYLLPRGGGGALHRRGRQ